MLENTLAVLHTSLSCLFHLIHDLNDIFGSHMFNCRSERVHVTGCVYILVASTLELSVSRVLTSHVPFFSTTWRLTSVCSR